MYFDDGVPAVLSTYQADGSETASAVSPEEAPDAITTIALFPGLVEDLPDPIAYIHLGEDGQPLASGWLESMDVRP